MRNKNADKLSVFLNGRVVGLLNKEKSGAIYFQYDPAWLNWDKAIPVSISLPLSEQLYSGNSVTAVFDGLLPDNEKIRERLAQRSGAQSKNTYDLLAALGRDCVGALQFLSEGLEPGPVGKIKGKSLSGRQIEKIINDLKQSPLGVRNENEFRISIAGVQDKTALLKFKNKWLLPEGTTPTTHILKPAIGKLSNGIDLSKSVENEYFCMTFLAFMNLPAAKTKIEKFGKDNVLVIERFDRLWAKDGRLLRLPQEDMCQALSVSPVKKYEQDGGPGIQQILNFLKGSDDPMGDQKKFLKAQMLFWLLGATDGHAKNFSLMLGAGGRFHLAPLYDVLSAQPNVDAGQIRKNQFKLAMSVGKSKNYNVDKIVTRHFIQSAEVSGISSKLVPEIVNDLKENIIKALEKTKAQLPKGFPKNISDSISLGVKNRLKTIEF